MDCKNSDEKENTAFKDCFDKAMAGDAKAQYHLALYYKDGESVDKNYKCALSWLQKSANQDFAEAQYELAMCYTFGQGTEADLKKAFFWTQKAASLGYKPAKEHLISCYKDGLGVEKDPFKVLDLLDE